MHHDHVPPLAAGSRLALSERELIAWGERFGRATTPPLVVALTGELGTGKTTLVQAIARGYGVAEPVTSPTFTIVHQYAGTRSRVYHLDLYRLENGNELLNLGWDEMLRDDALVLVEWPDRAPEALPHGYVSIELDMIDGEPDRRLLYAGGRT